jgi:Zn-dependent protease
MPFRCPYCNNYYCAEHRLPENHDCPEKWKANLPKTPAPVFTAKENQDAYEHTITYQPTFSTKQAKLVTFSKKEIQHLIIGTVLVMAVGISMMLEIPDATLFIASTLAVLFTASFLAHEIAHKITAQHYGLWAEFRLTLWGALITLVSTISPLKLISPGAVMISGSTVDRKIIGKTAIAGPLTNIVLAAILTLIAFVTPNPIVTFIAGFSAFTNAFLAFFNLIPFGIIDGYKIFWWNKLVWAATFAVSIALMVSVWFAFFA